ncbi:MAG TPA: hypothetical protein VLO11_04945 [Luteolibacter sp.]|nr:hypothetical protein [Luteolibacter sp.]
MTAITSIRSRSLVPGQASEDSTVTENMKTTSQIVAESGWRGTRLDRVKVKACIALIATIIFLIVSVSSLGTVLFYAFIPAVVSLIVSVVLFIRERPIEVKSLAGRVGTDPRKLYGWCTGRDTAKNKDNAKP